MESGLKSLSHQPPRIPDQDSSLLDLKPPLQRAGVNVYIFMYAYAPP